MTRRLLAVLVVLILFSGVATAYGQGGTTSTISGVVTDAGGGVVPGADIIVKHNATGVSQEAISRNDGSFSFPGLNVGTTPSPFRSRASRPSSSTTWS